MSQSDAELHTERLLDVVNDYTPQALTSLSRYDVQLVMFTRLQFARLMLGLAVKLELGVKPGARHD